MEGMARLTVRKAMIRDVVFLGRDAPAVEAAQKISGHKIGCVVVTGAGGEVVGIVTEKDLVRKVLAQGKPASSTRVSEIMSHPVITVDSDSDILEAAKTMSEKDVRRLPVVEKSTGKLIGIITDKDILRIQPEVVEILREFLSLRSGAIIGEQIPRRMRGTCELCDNFSDELVEVSGRLMCAGCREGVVEEGEAAIGENGEAQE